MKQIAARAVRAALLLLLLAELLWTLPWQPKAAGSCACHKNRCGKHPSDQIRAKDSSMPCRIPRNPATCMQPGHACHFDTLSCFRLKHNWVRKRLLHHPFAEHYESTLLWRRCQGLRNNSNGHVRVQVIHSMRDLAAYYGDSHVYWLTVVDMLVMTKFHW